MTPKTAKIYTDRLNGEYYLSYGGVLRSNKTWKTIRGATRYAATIGYEVTEVVAPEKGTKIVTNLLSGRLVRIDKETPACCDPSTETYWSM